jgi:hypothetical protein
VTKVPVPVNGYVSIPARGHVGGLVVTVKTWTRAEAIVLVRTRRAALAHVSEDVPEHE